MIIASLFAIVPEQVAGTIVAEAPRLKEEEIPAEEAAA
jgi:hypothetical protein